MSAPYRPVRVSPQAHPVDRLRERTYRVDDPAESGWCTRASGRQCWGVIVSFAAVAAGRLRRGLGFTRRGRLERLIDQSLRDGVGLHRQVFTVADPRSSGSHCRTCPATSRPGWSKRWAARAGRTGSTRWPLAWPVPRRAVIPFATVSLGVFRPSEYYTTGGLRDQIEQFVRALPMERINDEPRRSGWLRRCSPGAIWRAPPCSRTEAASGVAAGVRYSSTGTQPANIVRSKTLRAIGPATVEPESPSSTTTVTSSDGSGTSA